MLERYHTDTSNGASVCLVRYPLPVSQSTEHEGPVGEAQVTLALRSSSEDSGLSRCTHSLGFLGKFEQGLAGQAYAFMRSAKFGESLGRPDFAKCFVLPPSYIASLVAAL